MSNSDIPDFQTMMRPVLEYATHCEVRIRDAVTTLAEQMNLTDEQKERILPSGRQTVFANRVHWAKSYLSKAGLVMLPRRGVFVITAEGKTVLTEHDGPLNIKFLERFDPFRKFYEPYRSTTKKDVVKVEQDVAERTPDEELTDAFLRINESLADDLLDRTRAAPPIFFEQLIVELLIAMGYGGAGVTPGRRLGGSGDGGVDGVIDQDPLGVDQVYVQAKRYAEGNNVGPGAIREFFGALNIKRAAKGIFVTTSGFSQQARDEAEALGARIVMIDGTRLARLMIQYEVGCRTKDVLRLREVNDDFFEPTD